jgi:hypothetical protein
MKNSNQTRRRGGRTRPAPRGRGRKMAVGGKMPIGVTDCYDCAQWGYDMMACFANTLGPGNANLYGCGWDDLAGGGGSGCFCDAAEVGSATVRQCCNPHNWWDRSSKGGGRGTKLTSKRMGRGGRTSPRPSKRHVGKRSR